ncbi:MAG TPA: hypothetical protein PLE71_17710, partial [Flavobacteriales bacterium]|nr:hypothetical protein [Flavobacteriales bacterium]
PLALFLAFSVLNATAQSLGFVPVLEDEGLQLNKDRLLADGRSLTIETFKFFIGHATLFSRGQIVFHDSAYHLIDATDPESLNILLKATQKLKFDSVSFTLGVDSITSVFGAFGGDLDPTNGMYWTWNSGYINFKLEGTSPVCNTTKNAFNFHLGGYLAPYRSAQVVGLRVPSQNEVTIGIDLSKFFLEVDLAKDHTIMSPSARAVELSSILARSFHIVK